MRSLILSTSSMEFMMTSIIQTPRNSTLENGSIDIDEGNRGEGNVKEFSLPTICVNLDHDAGEGEAEDDKDEADEKPGKCAELVPNHPIQDQEGHIGNHASHCQVATPSLLQVIGGASF